MTLCFETPKTREQQLLVLVNMQTVDADVCDTAGPDQANQGNLGETESIGLTERESLIFHGPGMSVLSHWDRNLSAKELADSGINE